MLILVNMLSGKTKKKAAPESCDSCPRLRDLKEEKVRLAHLISKEREGFEERLNGNDLKLTFLPFGKPIHHIPVARSHHDMRTVPSLH